MSALTIEGAALSINSNLSSSANQLRAARQMSEVLSKKWFTTDTLSDAISKERAIERFGKDYTPEHLTVRGVSVKPATIGHYTNTLAILEKIETVTVDPETFAALKHVVETGGTATARDALIASNPDRDAFIAGCQLINVEAAQAKRDKKAGAGAGEDSVESDGSNVTTDGPATFSAADVASMLDAFTAQDLGEGDIATVRAAIDRFVAAHVAPQVKRGSRRPATV